MLKEVTAAPTLTWSMIFELRLIILASHSVETRVSVFYYTFSTIVLDGPVPLYGDPRHVLDVEVLEAPTAVRDTLHACIRHQGAALHTQLLEIGAVTGQKLEPNI